MTTPRLHDVQCLDTRGLHRMAYWEWGDPANPDVLLCVHGLSRQGRDFDTLAAAMSDRYRVVCPDVVGRGKSDWLDDPSGYQVPAYVADMVTLLARLDAKTVHWVGTSMGGLIGMGLAAQKNTPIRKLVLNDVGPAVRYEAIERIKGYLGHPARFRSLEEAADAMWQVSTGFGPHTREQWLALTQPMLVPDGDMLRLHYDPNIALPVRAVTPELARAGEAMLWAAYDAIRCPTLVIRGAESDLLARETAEQMTQRGPKAKRVELPGIGHAPMLVVPEQVALVREFLLAT